jgi:hypothetical protein
LIAIIVVVLVVLPKKRQQQQQQQQPQQYSTTLDNTPAVNHYAEAPTLANGTELDGYSTPPAPAQLCQFFLFVFVFSSILIVFMTFLLCGRS